MIKSLLVVQKTCYRCYRLHEKVIKQKTEATSDLIENKMVDKFTRTSASKLKPAEILNDL